MIGGTRNSWLLWGGITAIYALAFLYFCAISYFSPSVGPIATHYKAYTVLTVITLLCAVWFVVEAARAESNPSPSLVPMNVLGYIPFIAAIVLVAYLWTFNLDDKWAYYRTSRIILIDGVPNFNPGEWYNVNTSFLYPYLTLPGHLFDGYLGWEAWTKYMGFAFHLATAAIALIYLGWSIVGILTAAALLLYIPSLLWSIGGLETPMAIFGAVFLILAYLKSGGKSLWWWFFAGAMIWLRPDVILMGVGIFALQFLFNPRALLDHIYRGLAFSLPIVTFVVFNKLAFGNPLPSSFYIKGLHKAFSGHYPWYVDVAVGSMHTTSGIASSFLVVFIIGIGLWRLIFPNHVAAPDAPETARRPRYIAGIAGILVFLGYHILGGYQHMNFTFRYFQPGILSLTALFGFYLVNVRSNDTGAQKEKSLLSSLWLPRVAAAAMLLQIAQSAFVAYHVRWIDIALTRSALRDRFSVNGYADWMKTWMEAGDYFRKVAKPTDRIYLIQGMAAGSLSMSYIRDEFYAPANTSHLKDIKECPTQLKCISHFDYVATFPDPKQWPPGFVLDKNFNNIVILKKASASTEK